GIAILLAESLRNVANVLAMIGDLRKTNRLARLFSDAHPNAHREILDLRARVVVVELARHAPAGPLEQRGDRVAKGRLTTVTDVQRPGRIRRDELHVHGLATARIAAPIAHIGAEERREPARHDVRVHPEVDEPWTRDFGALDARTLE